jgi:hypothetical protein
MASPVIPFFAFLFFPIVFINAAQFREDRAIIIAKHFPSTIAYSVAARRQRVQDQKQFISS